MKKLLCFALTLFLIYLSSLPKIAKAENNYAMVISENAVFYSDQSLKFEKFILPFSYYVKIVNVYSEASRVIYLDNETGVPLLEGYVKNVDLNFSLTPSANPYPHQNLSLKCDEVLFAELNKNSPKAVISQNQEAVFYGYAEIEGENFAFVYTQGLIGYVRLSSFNSFTLPLHPDEALLHQNQQENTTNNNSNAGQNQVENFSFTNKNSIIITFAVIFASLILIYLILQPNKKANLNQSFFDDSND